MAVENKSSQTRTNRTFRTQVTAFVTRTFQEMRRDKFALFWAIGFPIGFYLLTLTIFVDISNVPADIRPEFKTSVGVTYGMFGALFSCLTVFGRQLATDVEEDRYQQFRAMSITPEADLLGRLLAGGAMALFSFLIVVAVAIPIGGTYNLQSALSPFVFLSVFLIFCLIWMIVSLLIVAAVGDARNANIITISVAMAAFYLTGFNGTSPGAFAGDNALLNILPNTLPTRLVVYHVTDLGKEFPQPPAPPEIGTVGIVFGYGAVAVLVGVFVMRRFYGGGN